MMKLQKTYKLDLFIILFIFGNLNAFELDISCVAADPGNEEISVSFAPYLNSDGYTNKSVRTCKNAFNPNSCEDGIDNFKYCKNPKQTFFIKTLNKSNKTFVVEDRCNPGFKKFKLVGLGFDEEEIILIDENVFSDQESNLGRVKNRITSCVNYKVKTLTLYRLNHLLKTTG